MFEDSTQTVESRQFKAQVTDTGQSVEIAGHTIRIGDYLTVADETRCIVGFQGDSLIHYTLDTEQFGYTLTQVLEEGFADTMADTAYLGSGGGSNIPGSVPDH